MRTVPGDGRVSGRVLAAGAALAVLLVVAWCTLHTGTPLEGRWRLMRWYAAGWVAFAAAALLLLRAPARQAVPVMLAGAFALQALAVCFPPTTTDDFYRYVWDGTVQAHGIDPYRYAPLSPELAPLRDPWLFPPDPRPGGRPPDAPDLTDLCTSRGIPHVCTRINRPTEHTIYPPVAEAYFLGLHYVSPHGHRQRAVQVAAAVLALATAGLLAAALGRAGRDPRAAVLWAWCPTVYLECGNNAHVDVLGVLLLVGALAVLGARGEHDPPSTRRIAVAGALFGAAVAVKLVPALAGPALLGRRARAFSAAAAGMFVLGYLPHIAAVGSGVLGYLPGYLHEEGYGGTERFGALRLLVPESAAAGVAVGVLAVTALVVWRGAATRPAAQGAVVMTGTAFVVVGPSQPWYGLLVVALAALAGRWEWLAVAAAAYPVALAGAVGVDNGLMQQRAYAPAAAAVAAVAAWRWARASGARASGTRGTAGTPDPGRGRRT
jgi:hypothetical protein